MSLLTFSTLSKTTPLKSYVHYQAHLSIKALLTFASETNTAPQVLKYIVIMKWNTSWYQSQLLLLRLYSLVTAFLMIPAI